jgi:aquaporin Z
VSETSIWTKCVAELIGTLVLVFIGCGATIVAGVYSAQSPLAFGLCVVALTYGIGGISGCHINPAVSISMMATGKMKPRDTVFYVLMQCLGAIVGAALLYTVFFGHPAYSLSSNGLGQNGYGESFNKFPVLSCFVLEAVLTFVFVLVFLGSTSEKAPKGFAGIATGFGLVMVYMAGMPLDGASANPARSLGPAVILAVFGGQKGLEVLNQLWLFVVAPIIGGLIAAGVWWLLGRTPSVSENGLTQTTERPE